MHLPPGKYRVYLRISQDQSGNEVGVDRQWDDLCPHVESSPGVTIVEVYRDPDVSATKENVVRPEFERLLQEIQPGERILCWHSDRFIRTTRDLLRVIKTGALVHALWSGHFDLSTPAGVAVAKTQIAWAEYEGQQKALRQKSSHAQRARAGLPFLGGKRPFGYDKNERSYVQREDEALLLVKAYEMLLSGSTTTEIAAYLNVAGTESSWGKSWNYNSVRQVLMAPRNGGILVYNGQEVGAGAWEPIVPEETYRAAARLLSDPKRRTAGPRLGRGGVLHFLIGTAECGVCHGPTRAMRKVGYSLYQCRNGHASARAEWLEARAAALIITRVQSPLSSLNAESVDTTGLRAELERLRHKAEELDAQYDADKIPMARYLKLSESNDAKAAEITKTLARESLSGAVAALLDVDDLVEHWASRLDARSRATISRAFFDRIEIIPRGLGETGKCHGRARFWISGDPEPVEA